LETYISSNIHIVLQQLESVTCTETKHLFRCYTRISWNSLLHACHKCFTHIEDQKQALIDFIKLD